MHSSTLSRPDPLIALREKRLSVSMTAHESLVAIGIVHLAAHQMTKALAANLHRHRDAIHASPHPPLGRDRRPGAAVARG